MGGVKNRVPFVDAPLMGVEIALIDHAHQLLTYPNFLLIRTNFSRCWPQGFE